MMTWKEVVERYGQDVADKMQESGMLDGITGVIGENGEMYIYESDIKLALKVVKGGTVGSWEWD